MLGGLIAFMSSFLVLFALLGSVWYSDYRHNKKLRMPDQSEIEARTEALERWNDFYSAALAEGKDYQEAVDYADSDGMIRLEPVSIHAPLPRRVEDVDPWANAALEEIEEMEAQAEWERIRQPALSRI